MLNTIQYYSASATSQSAVVLVIKLDCNIKMHIFLLFSIVLVTVYCAPVPDESQATIKSYEYNNEGSGNYNFRYSTSNGIFRQERGTVVNRGEPNEHIEVRGSFSYKRPDGKRERIEYTADEKGFHYSIKIVPTRNFSPSLVATLLGK